MELKQLRYFLKVAELRNYTRAAKQLKISQPALSRSIQKLEEQLGQPVFERKARSIGLTDAGTLLQSRAQQILSILKDTRAQITDDGRSGRIRLGAIPTIAPYYLPEILQTFSKAFPEATVIVHENTTDNLIKSCEQGETDLAILALPVNAKHLKHEKLFEEELLLVLPTKHPLVAKKTIRLKDVEPYPFVLLDEAHCLTDNIVSFCHQRSFQPTWTRATAAFTGPWTAASRPEGSPLPGTPTDSRVACCRRSENIFINMLEIVGRSEPTAQEQPPR